MERKVKLKAHLSGDSPRRVFTNFGYTFWRGEWTDLNKPTPALLKWLEGNEHITVREVPVGPLTSNASGREIQIDLIPVMTPVTLEKELGARGIEAKVIGKMSDTDRRETLKELILKENKDLAESISKEKIEHIPMDPTGPTSEDTAFIEPAWTKAELNKVENYHELQKIARGHGLSARGTKKALKSRILKRMSEQNPEIRRTRIWEQQ